MLRTSDPGRSPIVLVAVLVAAGAVLAACGSATAQHPAVEVAAADTARSSSGGIRHCLWRVDGGRSPVYLLGSIHFLRESDYPLPDVVRAAFDEAEIVAFEVDLDSMAGAAATLLAKGMLPGDQKLSDLVSESTWRRVEVALQEAGLPAAGFEKMRPWMLAISLTSFELMRSGFDPQWGIDQYLWNRAGEEGLRRIGLETVDQQIELLASLDEDASDDFLAYTLDELATVHELMHEITADWKVGRLDRLEALYSESAAEYPDILERLADDRNERWLPQIEALADGPDAALVVVGTLHLVGDSGLPNLLRAAGYDVTQQ